MVYKIKCDQMENEWDSEICMNCNIFRSSADIKKRWRCKLNSDREYRTNFHRIWLMKNAHALGILKGENQDEIIIEYVGKRKNVKIQQNNNFKTKPLCEFFKRA